MKKMLETQKFSLKRIAEAIGQIPTDGGASMFKDASTQLTAEDKKNLMSMVESFNQLGECLARENELVELANSLNEIARLGEAYAVNECGDWFQTPALKKDWKRLKEDVKEFQKVTQECYANYQQLGVLYENVGRILQRYYEIKSPIPEAPVAQPTAQPATPAQV